MASADPAGRRDRLAGRGRFRIDLNRPQSSWSPMPQRSVGEVAEDAKATRRAEVAQIVNALHEALPGGLGRHELARRVDARGWGPGRLAGALRQAVAEGLVRRTGWRTYRLTGPGDRA
jgi:hypothetical protein